MKNLIMDGNGVPFKQKVINGIIKRTFSPDVESDELKWHQDLKDREVTIIESGEWSYQTEDSLPVKLSKGDKLIIKKHSWHRVLKGTGNLIVEIVEY